MSRLSHVDAQGNARMVDVSDKAASLRIARAEAFVRMQPDTLTLIAAGGHRKGDVLTVARIAGIQAAKHCADLIPLCHPLPLDSVEVELTPDPGNGRVLIRARACAHWRTGVEMEALVAVSAAGLTIYDMCKAVDRELTLGEVQLVSKSGGKSGEWTRSAGEESQD